MLSAADGDDDLIVFMVSSRIYQQRDSCINSHLAHKICCLPKMRSPNSFRYVVRPRSQLLLLLLLLFSPLQIYFADGRHWRCSYYAARCQFLCWLASSRWRQWCSGLDGQAALTKLKRVNLLFWHSYESEMRTFGIMHAFDIRKPLEVDVRALKMKCRFSHHKGGFCFFLVAFMWTCQLWVYTIICMSRMYKDQARARAKILCAKVTSIQAKH